MATAPGAPAAPAAHPLTLDVDAATRVSAILIEPPAPRAICVLGHGAGAGMNHAFMAALALGLAARGIASLRYQFPYMEAGSRRPDRPPVAQATVRAAAAEAARRLPGVPLFAGGKSFGGRMTSQAQAAEPMPGVRGLVFVGFPLHPEGKPGIERAAHLENVRVPMLFLQGTRDELADLALLGPVVDGLGSRASLVLFDSADHAFHVPARTGRKDSEVMRELLDAAAAWMEGTT
jgi:predicted alpha/beta-hydrolase family hydrolase